ncbi:hypothetical protein HUJ04_003237 [Dendroctonus ponderosae]|nr:hypothetical protein HUJ04_003237 [Dendroctonus ponderosae]
MIKHILQPKLIANYNKGMGGVDKMDSLMRFTDPEYGKENGIGQCLVICWMLVTYTYSTRIIPAVHLY